MDWFFRARKELGAFHSSNQIMPRNDAVAFGKKKIQGRFLIPWFSVALPHYAALMRDSRGSVFSLYPWNWVHVSAQPRHRNL
jgi:hypothetical protein